MRIRVDKNFIWPGQNWQSSLPLGFWPCFQKKNRENESKRWGDGRCTPREQTSMYWAIQAGGWDNASEINRNKKKSRQNGAGCLTDEGSTCSYLEKQYGPSPSGRFSLVIVFQKPLLPELHTAPIWDNKLPTHSPSTSLNILSRLTTRFVRSDNRSIKTECTTFLGDKDISVNKYNLADRVKNPYRLTKSDIPSLFITQVFDLFCLPWCRPMLDMVSSTTKSM